MMLRRSVGFCPENTEGVFLTPVAERKAHGLALAEWLALVGERRGDDYPGLKERTVAVRVQAVAVGGSGLPFAIGAVSGRTVNSSFRASLVLRFCIRCPLFHFSR